jgi:hypothetical protein
MPRLAPVMTAVFPANSTSILPVACAIHQMGTRDQELYQDAPWSTRGPSFLAQFRLAGLPIVG